MRIGLCLISTGKYDVFVQPLIDSVDKWFFRQDTITIYLFTDKTDLQLIYSDRINIVTIPITHKPFPFATLYRYKYFTAAAYLIDTDYVFYSDVDMRFVGKVDREILGDIVSVMHPGFYKGGWGSEGCSKMSTAYLPPEMRNGYKAGGFQGGKKLPYLRAASELDKRISSDESIGVMAIYHDETHWNWYLQMRAKNVKTLDPSYCYPEASWAKGMPFVKRIMALEKDHKAIRE